METLIIIIFIISLIYLAKAEMIKSYVGILGFQGLLLFFMAYFKLKEIDAIHLIFILLETLIFKALFVPILFFRIVKYKNHRNNTGPVKGYYSVLIAAVIIALSFIVAHTMHEENLQVKYFTAAIASIFVGLFIAINHKDILTHLTSYLVLENGIFLLSLALGSEMPMFVNSAILLDIFTSVLIMGIFFNKLKDYFQNTEIVTLSKLKD
jgi:hydrogenase-4 component E